MNSIFHNNPKLDAKSKWNTDIRDLVKTSESANYDVISCNNVFRYFDSPEEVKSVIMNFERMLTDDGFLITDAGMNDLVFSVCGNLHECKSGIYAKSVDDCMKLFNSPENKFEYLQELSAERMGIPKRYADLL